MAQKDPYHISTYPVKYKQNKNINLQRKKRDFKFRNGRAYNGAQHQRKPSSASFLRELMINSFSYGISSSKTPFNPMLN